MKRRAGPWTAGSVVQVPSSWTVSPLRERRAGVAGFELSAALTADAALSARLATFTELSNLGVDSGRSLNLHFSPQWFTLDEVCKGKLHLKLEWLTLLPDASTLDKVLRRVSRAASHSWLRAVSTSVKKSQLHFDY